MVIFHLLILHVGACQQTYVLAAKTMPNSTWLYFSTGSLSSPTNFTLEIPGHQLPTHECGDDYIFCDILLIERESKLLIFLPSQGGFVKVTYEYGQSPHYSFHSVDRNCHPVKSFYNREHSRVLMECLNLSPNTTQNFYVAELNLITEDIRYSDISQRVQNAQYLSPAVHARGKIFVVENEELLFIEAKISDLLRAHVAFPMAGCSHVRQMDAVGEERVYMYCNDQTTWSMNTHAIRGNSQDSYIYPCPDSNFDLVVRDGRLNNTGNSTVIDLPAAGIEFGLCTGSGSTLAFLGLTANGLLYRVDLASDVPNITNLTQCAEGATCLRPAIDRSRTFGVYFDPSTSLVYLANFTSFCGHGTVSLPFHPDLLFTALGPGEYNCSCSNVPSESRTSPFPVEAVVVPIAVVITIVLVIVLIVW